MVNTGKYVVRANICNSKPLNKDQPRDINECHMRIGFRVWEDISPEVTSKQPGLNHAAERCLNSFWGKAAQRSGLTTYKSFNNCIGFVHGIFRSDTLHTLDTNSLRQTCVEIRYIGPSDHAIDHKFMNGILAGLFTSNARP